MWVMSVMSKKSKHSIVDFGNLREACLLTENSKEGFSVTIVEILLICLFYWEIKDQNATRL